MNWTAMADALDITTEMRPVYRAGKRSFLTKDAAIRDAIKGIARSIDYCDVLARTGRTIQRGMRAVTQACRDHVRGSESGTEGGIDMARHLQTLKHPPIHCDNPINSVAFLSFALWLAKQPEAVTDFRDKTNVRLPVSALDRMIDEATGHDAGIASEWLSYASRWHWGCTCCPNEAR